MDIAEAAKLHDDLLANMPEGARHDSDICSFCVDKAAQNSTTSVIPPAGDSGPDVSDQQQSPTNTEGGTPEPMDTISKETHEALLQKAVTDATSVTEQALETAKAEAKGLTEKVAQLEADNASLKADNDRLNMDLDTAQVSLKAAQDEVASLKTDIETERAEAAKRETASKRGEQAKNLGLFTEDYISEKASAWADLSEEQWTERVDEWTKLAPKKADEASANTDTAMSGTSGSLTETPQDEASKNKKPRAGRAALGLS